MFIWVITCISSTIDTNLGGETRICQVKIHCFKFAFVGLVLALFDIVEYHTDFICIVVTVALKGTLIIVLYGGVVVH